MARGPLAEVTSRRLLHKGRKFDFEMVDVRMPSGKTVQREIVRHPGAVLIVPVLDSGEVVLIRNFRISLERPLYECPAGTMEPPEPAEACAARELVEETGYEAATLVSLGWFYTTPGLTDEKMHAFVGKGLRPVGQDLEEDECISVCPVPREEAFAMIDRGEITDAKSMLALLLARRRGLL
jgi:ADP-ribose pyrophosphatase